MKIYLDSESAGLKSLPFNKFDGLHTFQYSLEQGDIKIIRLSKADPKEIEYFLSLLMNPNNTIVGYNLKFDLHRFYCFFKPEKFFQCQTIDLWNHLMTSHPYNQFPLISKKEVVRLKRIHEDYTDEIISLVEKEIKNFILPGMSVKVTRHEEEGPFETLGFRLEISRKLKDVVSQITGEDTLKFDEVMAIPKQFGMSKENLRTPVITPEEQLIYQQTYDYNEKVLDDLSSPAYTYMTKDIEYLWLLEKWLNEKNEKSIDQNVNDTCTHIVAATKYYGFGVRKKEAQKLKKQYIARQEEIKSLIPINLQSFPQRLELIKKHLLFQFPLESTDKRNLEILLSENLLDEEGQTIVKMILEYNPLNQRIKQLEVFNCNRIYPDFRVIGTPTNRMSGTGGINWQGVSRESALRSLVKCSQGGDFDGLEITIAAKVFGEKNLTQALKNGVDVHAMTTALLVDDLIDEDVIEVKGFPTNLKDAQIVYSFIKNNKSTPCIKEMRNKGKAINFLVIYFGTEYKLSEILNIPPEMASEKMDKNFFSYYPGLKETRKKFYQDFCTADFETWDKKSVSQMKDQVQDIFGTKRIIKFEKSLASFFWEKCDRISKIAKEDDREVIRMEAKGKQLIRQTIRSACLGAASTIQKSLYRMLGNFQVQTPGATLTKMLMCRLWNKFHVPMMNVHDEIIIPEEYRYLFKQIQREVKAFIKQYQPVIPYLGMDWNPIKYWSDK